VPAVVVTTGTPPQRHPAGGERQVLGVDVHGDELVLDRLADRRDSGHVPQIGYRGRPVDVVLPLDLAYLRTHHP
jgi:hypothetical protein